MIASLGKFREPVIDKLHKNFDALKGKGDIQTQLQRGMICRTIEERLKARAENMKEYADYFLELARRNIEHEAEKQTGTRR